MYKIMYYQITTDSHRIDDTLENNGINLINENHPQIRNYPITPLSKLEMKITRAKI